MRQASITPFSVKGINGDYKATPNFCSESIDSLMNCGWTPNLWEVLYSCKTLKDDSLRLLTGSFVNLNFDGKKKLIVSLIDSGKVIKQIELKAKTYKQNLAVKRKLLLIPIPIFFYIRNERKVLLATNTDNSLNVGYLKINEGQIFFGTSWNFLFTLYYPRIKD